ncbi:MAG: polysaccharide export outer membrane protein, partial [Myxococcota bacterium]
LIPNIASVPLEERRALEPEQFQLGPGDEISITVWRHPDLNLTVTIAPDGSITYPLVGTITIAGMTFPELSTSLTEAISEYYEDPQVAVNITDLNSQKVFVLGDGVGNPQVLQLENEMSVLEALTRAGGLSSTARTRNVLLVRGGIDAPSLYTIDVNSIYSEGRMDQMIYLQQGDIVVVPNRTITNVANYFREVQGVLSPFVSGSAVYRNVAFGTGPDASAE